jgi:ribosomal-protein-alanine N-acetyltransferase
MPFSQQYPPGLVIRPVTPADLPSILVIENLSYPDPWAEEQFRQELLSPVSSGLAAERGGNTLAGFCFFWTVADEVDIHSISVHPDHRRKGIGAALLHEVLAAAHAKSLRRLTLEVRAGNAAAIGLYATNGFAQDSVRRSYYPDGEDALLMSRPV